MQATNLTFDAVAATSPAKSAEQSSINAAYWALRVGAAMCFIGHGAFGFITKAAWLPYFAVIGIPASVAWRLMPLIGAIDVTVGMAILFAPRAIPLAYMSVWALWTSLLRPLAGEGVFEAVERAGNYGVPLALLILTAWPFSLRNAIRRLDASMANGETIALTMSILKWTTGLLLAGHGALGAFVHKHGLVAHYAAIGLPATTAPIIGWFELALAIVVVVRPAAGLLLFIAAWKIATESLFAVSGAPIWELVERGGSYAAPLALAALRWEMRRDAITRE